MSSNRLSLDKIGSVRRALNAVRALFGLVLAASLAGCFAADEEPSPDTNPLLYEIVGPGGEVEGWMLGTIHLLPDDVAWRTKAIDDVVKEADLLAVEIADLEDQDAIARVFAELATTHGLPGLPQRVAPSKRPALLEMIERSGYSPSDFTSVETWAAALMLAQGNALGKPENGVDRAVLDDFADREIVEFEGAVEQLTIFDTLAEEDQRVLLDNAISEASLDKREGESLLRAWLTGDIAALEEATTTGAMEDSEVRDALLVNRNRAWLRKLLSLLRASDRPLIAVGAAHLVGPDGLPEMLKQRGYTVRRIGK